MNQSEKIIAICMGSSCYAKGNVYNVEIIQLHGWRFCGRDNKAGALWELFWACRRNTMILDRQRSKRL